MFAIELRTAKPLGTSRKTIVTLTPMQRGGAKKAFMKKHGGDFEAWVERAVERNRLMIDISEDGSEEWTVFSNQEEMETHTYVVNFPMSVRIF